MTAIFSAPMAGVSDYPFRKMLRHFTSCPLFSEMISAETIISRHPKTLKMLTFPKERNIIVQLVGANPLTMAEAAKHIEQMGVMEININMGCPVKKLIQNHSGAKLMQDHDLAKQIVTSVKNAIKIPVSVKTRLGWENPNDIKDFAKLLENAGADSLIVHARTQKQGYSGQADWKILNSLKINIPYFVNGDIKDFDSAQLSLKQSHAAGIMVGRALLGRPWQLKEIEINKPHHVDMAELVLEHLDEMLSYYGHHGLYIARKHLAWYANHKKGVAKWRQKMYLEEDEQKLKKLIVDFWKGEN